MWRSHPNFDDIGVAFIKSLWADVPSHIDAAYEDVEGSAMLFFKGIKRTTDVINRVFYLILLCLMFFRG